MLGSLPLQWEGSPFETVPVLRFMRLLSLRLGGFKSFVDPTTLSLRPGILAVTGPNGAGKSNLIDAVRWVTGEMSAKALRSESMADVIFNGSSHRKPAATAFVELVFDNSDGSLGGEYANYAEITIRRTVGRDGVSDYSLNGTPCRRRDIVDVFLGTGLGPDSYALIEQGTIGRLVESRPEELRAFLEEAAGVSRYRERRRETAARIETARENLARLGDLAREIAERTATLARQARAAERYRELRDEERRLQACLRAGRRRAFRGERAVLQRRRDEAAAVLTRLAAERTRLDATFQELQDRRRESLERVQEHRRRHHELDREIVRLESARTSRQREREALQAERERLVEEARRLEIERTAARRLLEANHGEWETLRPDHERALGELAAVRAALEQARTATNEAREALQNAEAARREARHTRERLALERDHLERTDQELGERLRALGASLAALPLETWKAELSRLREEREGFEAEQSRGLAEREEIRRALEALTGERRELESQLAKALADHDVLREEEARLRARYEAALAPPDEAVRRWLEQRGLVRAPRLLELLDVSPEHRTLVEALLDEAVRALVVEDLSAVVQGIPEERTASLVFVERRPSEETGTYAVALRPRDPALGSFLAAHLAHVRAVVTLPEALARRAELGPYERFVTPEGVIVGRSWLRLGKTTTRQNSLFALPEALVETVAMREAQAQDVEKRRIQLETLAHERERRERQLRELDERLRTLDGELTRRRTAEAATAARLAQAEEQARRLREEERHVRARREELSSRLALLEEAWSRHDEGGETQDQRVACAAEAFREAEERLARIEEDVRRAQDAERALALTLEACQVRAESARRDEERLLEESRRLAEALARSDERLAQLVDEDEREAVGLPTLVEDRLGLERLMHEAEDLLHDLENALATQDEARRRWQAEHEEQRVQVSTLDQKIADLDRRLAELGPVTADEETGEEEGRELESLEEELVTVQRRLERLGPVNLMAIEEYEKERARGEELARQLSDVREGLESLEEAMRKIDRECDERFRETFELVNAGLAEYFPRLFGGGEASLVLGRQEGDGPPGVWFTARPPGKKPTTVNQISGGEKALAGLAFLFALFRLNPAPFCMLDEVDAAMDEASVGRFLSIVREFADRVQMIVVTHNRLTLESADTLIGVTMNEPGVSRLVTVAVDEAVSLAATA